jgi:tetratricopeptide (TPR) repeat protein
MKRIKWLSIVMLGAMAASATGVKIAGTLTTASGTPLAGATVSLVKAGLSGTTDEDGMFGLYGDINDVLHGNAPAAHAANPVVIGNSVLCTVLKATSNVKLDAFNAKGARIYSTELRNPAPGVCRLEIKPSGHALGNGLVLIRLAIDDKISVLKANTLAMKSVQAAPALVTGRSSANATGLAKDMTAAIDTLKIQATGYKTAMLPIATYQLSTLTLSLDTGLTAVSIDTSKSTPKQDFLALVQRYKDLYYGQCFGAEKTSVDSALFTLKAAEPFLSAAAGKLSASAIMLMAKALALHASVVFAAAAALTTPDSADIVNNFGAVLRMLDQDSDAVTVLLYANKLYPHSPLILTNLANTLLELGDDMKAEAYYRQALKANSQYGPAHQGLGTLYLKRMDYLDAINEFFAAAEFAFYGTSTKAITGSEIMCGGMPDGPFGQETGDATGTSDPSNPDQSSLAPDDQLYIPPYPNWNGLDQFIAGYDDSKRWNDDVSAGMYGCLNWAMDLPKQMSSLDSAGSAKIAGEIRFFEREIYGEQCLAGYFGDKINTAYSQDSAALATLATMFGNALDQDGAKYTSDQNALTAEQPDPANLAAVAAWEEKWKQCTIDYNKKLVVDYDNYFGKWAVIQRKSYNATKQQLEEFWLYTEPFMKQLYCGGLVFKMVDNSRRSFVYTQMYRYTGALPMLSLAFSYYETAKEISQATPDMTPPSKIDSTKVPQKKEPSCPFANHPLLLGLGAASFTLDCESVEVEAGEGIIGAVKYNYHTKETTGFIGGGYEARLGVEQLGVAGEAKAGFFFTADQNGNITDGGAKASIAAAANLGPATQTAETEVRASAVTGVNVEYINKIGLKGGLEKKRAPVIIPEKTAPQDSLKKVH